MTTLSFRPSRRRLPRRAGRRRAPTETADGAGAPEIQTTFSHRQILIIMSGLMLGMFLATLDQTIVEHRAADHRR